MKQPIKITRIYNFENELEGLFQEVLDYYDDEFISDLFKIDVGSQKPIKTLSGKKYILAYINNLGMASYLDYTELYEEFVRFSQENVLGQEYIILLLQMRQVFAINTFLMDKSMETIRDLNHEIIYSFFTYLFEKDLNLIPLAS